MNTLILVAYSLFVYHHITGPAPSLPPPSADQIEQEHADLIVQLEKIYKGLSRSDFYPGASWDDVPDISSHVTPDILQINACSRWSGCGDTRKHELYSRISPTMIREVSWFDYGTNRAVARVIQYREPNKSFWQTAIRLRQFV